MKQDVKVKMEESDDDFLSIHQDIENSFILDNMKEEIKEEESVDNALSSYITDSSIKEEIKEEVEESDQEESVDDSNLDTDNLVDSSEYVQVQMNLNN